MVGVIVFLRLCAPCAVTVTHYRDLPSSLVAFNLGKLALQARTKFEARLALGRPQLLVPNYGHRPSGVAHAYKAGRTAGRLIY